MVSSVETQHLTSRLYWELTNFAPGSTSLQTGPWVDMGVASHLAVTFFRLTGTSAITNFQLVGNSASDGSGTTVVIVTKDLTGNQPDASGDQVHIEMSAEQLRAEGEKAGQSLRYGAIQLQVATGTDTGVLMYLRQPVRFMFDAMTPDKVA